MKRVEGFERYSYNEKGELFNTESGYQIKMRLSSKGYPAYKISGPYVNKKRKQKYIFVHRIIADYHIPNPKGLPFVNHKDGNKENFSVDNLEWCTLKENSIHASENFLLNNKNRIKDDCKILTMLTFASIKGGKTKISNHYGVSYQSVQQILKGRTYKEFKNAVITSDCKERVITLAKCREVK